MTSSDSPRKTHPPEVSIYKDKAGEWRWRLIASNGEIVAQGEGHKTRYNAERAVVTAQQNFQEAKFDSHNE